MEISETLAWTVGFCMEVVIFRYLTTKWSEVFLWLKSFKRGKYIISYLYKKFEISENMSQTASAWQLFVNKVKWSFLWGDMFLSLLICNRILKKVQSESAPLCIRRFRDYTNKSYGKYCKQMFKWYKKITILEFPI